MNHSERHYPQMAKSRNSAEPSPISPQESSDGWSKRSQKSLSYIHRTTALWILLSVSGHDSWRRKTLANNGVHGRVAKNPKNCRTKRTLWWSPNLGKILCGLMSQEFNFLESVCPIKSGMKVLLHFRKNTPTVIWWRLCHSPGLDWFSRSWKTGCDEWIQKFCSIRKSSKDCPSICIC